MSSFVHLHVHSSFSPGWGVHGPEALCRAARSMGYTRLALTDTNGLYGIVRFIEAAREAGMEPIIGAEAATGTHRAVLLVENEGGYANLCRVLSDLHCRGDFDLVRSLLDRHDGLHILTDDPGVVKPLKRTARDRLHVELSPGHDMHRALALSRETGLPPVATTRAVLLHPDDLFLHRVLRAIDMNTTLSRLTPSDTAGTADLLLPAAGAADYFPHCPEAIANTDRLARRCWTGWDFNRVIFPAFRGMEAEEAFHLLEERARLGIRWRYGETTDDIESRLAKELSLIREKGFAHYFLVVEELAKRSPRTCGRGSAAASLVAYCLGITHVDPLKHNLFFERFLNPGRIDPPDIDVDFPWDERDDILDFAFARYGSVRTAMVANQVGFRARAAVREVAKVFGMTPAEIKDFTRRLSGYWRPAKAASAASSHPLFDGRELNGDWERVLDTAARLEGQMRHLSLHCGGLVIVPDDIRRYVPVQVSAKGLPVIQWEKDQTEAAGLVKIDILGNRSLAVIRDALAAIKANTGADIDYARWQPLEDEPTRRLIRTGRTMGCFYIESPATRQLLRRMWGEKPEPHTLRCDLFEHLVMASSIIRPAANAFIMEFVARMRGKPWRSLHPLLDDVLNETYGIAIYQEQITRMVMALADFSACDGDQLRKIVTKKHRTGRLEDYRQRFLAGGRRKGVDGNTLEKVWDQILSFAGYSFCKPHSASYALVSCKSAFLKANHPAEFTAAVISNQGGFYSALSYLSEARRAGLDIRQPDINHSRYHYTGRGDEVRVGLMQIQGLGRKVADRILEERDDGGPYRSFTDFLNRVRPDPTDARALVKAGCFDALEGLQNRPALLWQLLAHGHGETERTPSLFEEETRELPVPLPYDESTVLDQELDTLGFLASRHPLDLYRQALDRIRTVPAAEMDLWAGRHVTMAGWWVTAKPVRTRHGEPMEFVTFEDTTGTFDATFFPRAYARFCRKLTRHRPYVVKGRVEVEFGVATLNVKWVEAVGWEKGNVKSEK
ncbi:MAG: DNA polymerase III subunit alpha [bacterium]|nr:MAG: DNA polymerase III subunit alpha [bacterium]